MPRRDSIDVRSSGRLPIGVATSAPRAAGAHGYYLTVWAVVAALTLWGFGPSFFVRGLFEARSLPPLLRLHGLVMTAWLVVFLIQARLVASGHIRWHRWFGPAGAIAGVAVIAVGLATIWRAARLQEGPPGAPIDIFVLGSVCTIAAFALFFAAALASRRCPDWHQRLMLLATLMLLGAGTARLPYERFPVSDFWRSGGPWGLFALDLLVIYACVAWDTIRNRRLHPAFGWGIPVLLVINNGLVAVVAAMPAWHDFIRTLAA